MIQALLAYMTSLGHSIHDVLFKKHMPTPEPVPTPAPAPAPAPAPVGKIVDLRDKCPPISDQGQLGACTAFGIAGAYEFEMLRQGEPSMNASQMFIYYNERVIEGTVSSDSGAMISDGIDTIAKYGVCDEQYWPYDIKKFKRKPPKAAYTNALRHKSLKSAAISPTVHAVSQSLDLGFPVIVGIQVYSSFQSETVAATGVVPMPTADDVLEGGHCVLIVGYDDDKQQLIVRNSWGTDWGDKGYFRLPYTYIAAPFVNQLFAILLIV